MEIPPASASLMSWEDSRVKLRRTRVSRIFELARGRPSRSSGTASSDVRVPTGMRPLGREITHEVLCSVYPLARDQLDVKQHREVGTHNQQAGVMCTEHWVLNFGTHRPVRLPHQLDTAWLVAQQTLHGRFRVVENTCQHVEPRDLSSSSTSLLAVAPSYCSPC